jgi:hypothetical protein
MKAVESFATITDAIHDVGHVVLLVPKHKLVYGRYVSLIEALREWKTVCQRFDDDFEVWVECNRALKPLEGWPYHSLTDGQGTDDEQQVMKLIRQHKEVSPKLRLDIRSVYIFAKIAFINFAGLLFAMAEEPSRDWQQHRRFKQRISRTDSPELLQKFSSEFGHHIEWFEAQVNLYRNDFIEHPWSPTMSNLVGDSSTVRISELIGQPLSFKDAEVLKEIASELLEKFPELNTVHLDLQLYQWVCRNLEHVPKTHRNTMQDMIRRIGLESGDVGQIAQRANLAFADFIAFFGKWYKERRDKKGAPK